jgi:4-cresol dehydrogenase (hydroxylating)
LEFTMTRILPPDVSEADFDAALGKFRAALGAEWVLSTEEELKPFADPFPTTNDDRFKPGAVVSPATPEEVQEIVRIANEFNVPLSPVSTGRNLGYGGAAPRLSGAVVVNTGARMKRIIEVNEKYAYALVEPGVTYFELYNHIQEQGYKLWIDVPDLGWGSVVGNTLDRGVGYTPYGDHLMWQTGLEVVLPDGDLLRTGMGAMPGTNAWQLFPYGFGPHPDGLFTQSNYGIVTKMGIALMPEPPGALSYLITFENESDLPAIIDTMLPLRIGMAPLQNVPVLRNILLDAGVVSKRSEWHEGDGPIPAEAIERMKRELDLGYWNFYGTVYGPPQQTELFAGMIKDAFLQIPGARFFTTDSRPEAGDRGAHVLHDRHKINRGIPSTDESKLFEWVPNGGHIGFSPVSAPDGADAWKQYEMVRDRCHEFNKDYAAQFIIGLREMHHICLFLYDTAEPAERDELLGLTSVLIDDAAAEGYGEYRTHLALMDQVMGTFNYNDGALLRFHERIKDALDPNSIMAPGKSGIWGSRFKGRGF